MVKNLKIASIELKFKWNDPCDILNMIKNKMEAIVLI